MCAGPVRFKRVPWLWSPSGLPWEKIGPGEGTVAWCFRYSSWRRRGCYPRVRAATAAAAAVRVSLFAAFVPFGSPFAAAAAHRFSRANFKSFFRFSSLGRPVHDKNTFVFGFFFYRFSFRSGHVVCDQWCSSVSDDRGRDETVIGGRGRKAKTPRKCGGRAAVASVPPSRRCCLPRWRSWPRCAAGPWSPII